MLDRFKTTNPVWCVTFAFALSIAAARWVSYVNPGFHYNFRGMHIHHYMYGIFMITFAGYCALVFKGPKATFWIALLYGWGAGFTFDEMSMWLNSYANPRLRWEYDGLIIGFLGLAIAGLFSIGIKKKSEVPATEREVFDRQLGLLDKSTIDAVVAPVED
jgi:uncharacterized membrane protein YagU involved in acid resistance